MKIQYKSKTITGFTLIELLIAVAIIGILASVAYPTYNGSIQRARCEEAKRTLVEASQRMETFYAMNLNYSGAVSGGVVTIFTANTDFSEYYTLSGAATNTTYTLGATPIVGSAQSDAECGTLTISHTGNTTSTSGDSW